MKPGEETGRGSYGGEKSREHLEKRIKELRKRKKRQRRSARRPFLSILPVLILTAFFLLCLTTSILALSTSGGGDGYLTSQLSPSNQEEIEARAALPGEIAAPPLNAAAGFLIDPDTGDVLYEKNADQSLPMASTTKIMTAVVVMENARLEEDVYISANASQTGESSIWLEEGEVLTVEQLLYALMVQSANDAATALAEHVGGSVEGFARMMNEKAAELGAANTHFSNPHGLDQEGHYSSARDLSLIAACAMKDPLFREIILADGYRIPWPGSPYDRVLENHNLFLEMYPYATGIKTGYTSGAGRCLVASASKDGRELISTVLNSDDWWNETVALMDYGFNDFERVEFAYEGQSLARVSVGDFPRREVDAVAPGDLSFTVRRDNLGGFDTATVYYREWLPYPVESGQEVGYLVSGEETDRPREVVLLSDESCLKPGALVRFFSFIAAVLGMWWRAIQWLIPGI